jgi:uncharacterized membrane protein
VKINRIIFWLALAGMVLAVHLWIQKARGFDQGCLGLMKPLPVVEIGCREVAALRASHLLGISNAAWGFAFYFGVALLALAQLVVSPRWARGFHVGSEVAVSLGLVYSGYLVFTMVVVSHVMCWLCLSSAGLVLALFALHAVRRRRGGFQPIAEADRGTELGFAALGMLAGAGLLVGVLVFVNRLGTRPLDQGVAAQEPEEIDGRALPALTDSKRLNEMRACRFDPWVGPVDLGRLVPRPVPYVGKADGLNVVVFYDPNCPHCAVHFPQFMSLAERYGERARFTILPRLLGARSILQTAALRLAEPTDKYYELWARLLAPRPPGHVTPAQIAEHVRALGLDATDLERRLEALRPEVISEGRRCGDAGISSTPTVLIGSRKVAGANLSPECLGRLIEDELGRDRH